MINAIRVNISLTKKTLLLLKELSKETGLKMSTIVEKGIILFNKENEQRDSK